MMSESLFATIQSCMGTIQSNRIQTRLCLVIAISGLLSHPNTARGQWKLESQPPKATEKKPTEPKSTKRPVAKPSARPSAGNASVGDLKSSESSPDRAQRDVPAQRDLPARARTPVKPVSMRVIEKDNQRFVHVPRAAVRCGPGADYYPTDVLPKGTVVEVYVETDDGWSGIRPPSGSHNWVQADSLYLMPGGRVAEVSAENVPAWVGSDAVKSDKLLYQTELIKTQTVSILGEAYRGQDDEKKLWFRIAPPQGEFRWIKSSMIGTTPVAMDPQEPRSAPISTPNSTPNSSPNSGAVAQAAYQEPSDSKLAWSDETEQTQRVRQEIEREQQQAQSSILSKAPKGSAVSKTHSTPQSRATANRPKTVNRSQDSRTMPRASREYPQVEEGNPSKNEPWQLIRQRQVGPEQTDSMNHILGIFGLSMVDPNNIQGHPQQGHARAASTTRGGYSQVASAPNSHLMFPQGALSKATSKVTANANSATAGIEHLPRPSGRYSQRRYSDFGSLASDSFIDRPSPLIRQDPATVSTASFTPYDSSGASAAGMSDYRPQEEVEAFQTPQIQDALTQLSIIVSRPSEQWNLAPLRDSAKMWIERGDTPLIRGEARLLLDRIERFEAVRQRTSMTPLPAPTNYSDAVPLRTPSSESEMSGWLVAVHTSLAGQPEFALTDDLGNVKAYVRPTTGLNLRRYVQQPVTVFGPQGFLPNLNAKQVVADRVVRLR